MAPARPPPPPVGVAGPGPGPPSRQPAGWREASWCVLKKGWEPSEELSGSEPGIYRSHGDDVLARAWKGDLHRSMIVHMDSKTIIEKVM